MALAKSAGSSQSCSAQAHLLAAACGILDTAADASVILSDNVCRRSALRRSESV